MTEAVLFEQWQAAHGCRIGSATLNAEKKLNALSLEMIDLLAPQLAQWADDDGIAMVVLQAAGSKAFCAGGDLHQLYRAMRAHHASPQHGDIRANAYAAQFFEREYRLNHLIHTYPKPILCWGHGIVMGGGMGLMAGASHRVTTEASRLAMPEISVGLYPDVGGSWFLGRAPGKLGLFLALTGAALNGSDAKFAGLADYAIADASRKNVFEKLLQQDWRGADASVLLTRILRQAERASRPQADMFAVSPLRQHQDKIDDICSAASLSEIVEGLLALRTGDASLSMAIAALSVGSPGSAALSYRLRQRAKHLSLAQVFQLEFTVSMHCAARPDFTEGIRALLIDKDRKPQWHPATLDEITPQWVDTFFEDPWPEGGHPLADLVRPNRAAPSR